jgi:hypothetical protein
MVIGSTSHPFSIADILDSISDDISLKLFKIIAEADNNNNNNGRRAATKQSSSLFDAKNKITRKQYYSRMKKFTECELTKRSKGRYSLTSLGKVIHYNLRIIENACQIQWKLKAFESIESSNIPAEARIKIFDSLIEDETIREIVFPHFSEAKEYQKDSITQEQTSSSILVKR